MTPVIVAIVALAVGLGLGFFIRKLTAQAQAGSAENRATQILEDSKREAESRKREALVEAKDEAYKLRLEVENELKERRQEATSIEKRLLAREESLDERSLGLDKKEQQLSSRDGQLKKMEEDLSAAAEEHRAEMERLAGMTTEEARATLMKTVEEDTRHEAAKLIRDIEQQAKEEADKKARNIISLAIQRTAADHVAEATVSVVALPQDEMKGRIIGREGRNIRQFETITGVNVIIDDTPEAVILSSFDPVRREVARLTLEKLIQDGRIHPARIEEMFEKSQGEVDAIVREAGEQATLDSDVHGVHAELVKTMGRLKYRTSYGQNVLLHSLEVAHLAGVMAAELGADVRLAKRAGFLHDLGKAVDHEVEGPHAVIGADLAKRFGENEAVLHAIEAHHGDVEPHTVEAVLVQAADAISAARPGARRETLESYVKRLEKLEAIAEAFDGVEKTFAMQAGREIRIMVKPDEIGDGESVTLARDIAHKIEEELQYPGQIKVTVIRESRAVDYAK
jgi:ribonucrease Y